MRILNIAPAVEHGRGKNRLVARFDVQVTEHILLRNMTLRRKPDGTLRVFSPHWKRQDCVSLAPELAQQITEAADAEYKADAHDFHTD